MARIKLNRPDDEDRVGSIRFDVQLKRRGVADKNKDGYLDAADGITPERLDQIAEVAASDPVGAAIALDPSEVGQLAIESTLGDRVRDILGRPSLETSASEAVQRATDGVGAARFWGKQTALRFRSLSRAGRHDRERCSAAAAEALMLFATQLNAAARLVRQAAGKKTIGAAHDGLLPELCRALERLRDVLTELGQFDVNMAGGWVGPYYASQLRELPVSFRTLRRVAEDTFGVDFPELPLCVE